MTLEEIKLKILMNAELCWYSAVLCGIEVELNESPSGTAHTDGLKIVVAPDFFNTLSVQEAQGLLLHELRHITDLHILRKGTREAKLWNVACDYAINNELVSEGFLLPQGGLVDMQYANMSAEEIYEKLLQDPPPSQKKPDPMAGDMQGEPTPEDAATMADSIKDLVIQATQQAQQQIAKHGVGKIPGSIQRMVESWVNPILPWQTVLRRYMSAKAKQDHSWRKPSRRYCAQKLYMPSLHSEAMGPIHIFIDASGSVSEEMFAMQVGQFKWIHKNLKPSELRVIVFDTKIQEEHIFRPNERLDVTFTGYGGTSIEPVVQYMKDHPCVCNLVFTDGHFRKASLEHIKGDVLAFIYDNPKFTWEGAKVVEIVL